MPPPLNGAPSAITVTTSCSRVRSSPRRPLRPSSGPIFTGPLAGRQQGDRSISRRSRRVRSSSKAWRRSAPANRLDLVWLNEPSERRQVISTTTEVLFPLVVPGQFDETSIPPQCYFAEGRGRRFGRRSRGRMQLNDTNNRVTRPPGGAPAEAAISNAGTDRLAHQIDHQRIATRAHELYQSRSGGDGSAEEDWRQAEAEYVIRRAQELRLP